jgi:hypothetical protein
MKADQLCSSNLMLRLTLPLGTLLLAKLMRRLSATY